MRAWLPGLLVLIALTGCGEHDAHDGHDAHGHAGVEAAHVHAAPHGGTLVVLAEEALHIELVLDPDQGRLTCYVLGAHADSPVRLEQGAISVAAGGQELELRAVANPLTGETAGDTSQFEVVHDALAGVTALDGTVVSLSVRGKTFEDVPFGIGGAETR